MPKIRRKAVYRAVQVVTCGLVLALFWAFALVHRRASKVLLNVPTGRESLLPFRLANCDHSGYASLFNWRDWFRSFGETSEGKAIRHAVLGGRVPPFEGLPNVTVDPGVMWSPVGSWLALGRSLSGKELRSLSFSTCAIVGNGGTLLNSTFGDAIDSHEAVWRFNNARTHKFEEHTGNRTTLRVLNNKWAGQYALLRTRARDGRDFSHRLPLEAGVTLVVTRDEGAARAKLLAHKALPRINRTGDAGLLWVPVGTVEAARSLLLAYSDRWTSRHSPSFLAGAGHTPSTGYLAVYLASQVCSRLTLYGFGPSYDRGGHPLPTPLHYHDGDAQKLFSGHSFTREMLLYEAWAQSGKVKMCHFFQGRCDQHDTQCGLVS
eukprot:jgi/Mesvir1/9170/Mv06910-RA.1